MRGIDAGERLRGRDHLGLAVDARRGEARLAGAVVVDRGAADHGVDRVAVGERVVQPLEHDEPDAGAADACPRRSRRTGGSARRARGSCPPGRGSPRAAGTLIDTPPASAMSHSPRSSARHAMCTATSDVEHAVCTVTLGPRRSSLYETRVAEEVLVVAEHQLVAADRRDERRVGEQMRRAGTCCMLAPA